ncbi:MAG TPA: PfkB family carbohydrate kinase [Streptosporangiaceae bacterium]|nr:PfkB family carbohydrate kinase [Streptosporangiaceae bacterium]
MIGVCGEALIDMVVRPDGSLLARPGGAAFNTSRTLARLGWPVTYLGRLADDGFGALLRDSLSRDGVRLGVSELSADPTTLAVVDLDDAGSPRFRFYLAGTSAPSLDHGALTAALPADLTALHAGSLALTMEPIASALEVLITRDLPPDVIVMVDPNCRPSAIADKAAYRERLFRILRRADIVKVSAEDLAYLFPGLPLTAAATELTEWSAPALVLVTDGPRPARALLPSRESVAVDVPVVEVADTIGAGDAFGGAFLGSIVDSGQGASGQGASRLGASGLNRATPVRAALQLAVRVAALTCTRVGAEPPWRHELA